MRTAGASINTVTKLVIEPGTICAAYLDEIMRDLPRRRLQVDELWAF